MISSNETQVVFDLPAAADLTLRLRPAKFLRIVNEDATVTGQVCLDTTDPDDIRASFPSAGRYILTSSFTVTSTADKDDC